MVSRRKKRRKLKKNFIKFLVTLLIVVGIVLVIFFGFQIKKVSYSSDLNQYNAQEIQAYLKEHGIHNSLWFWTKDLFGANTEIDMFESYSVSLSSPVKVTIKAEEKKLSGCFAYGENYFYFDEKGEILKTEPCAYKQKKKGKKKLLENSLGIVCYTNVQFNNANLYQKLNTKDKEGAETMLNMTDALHEMKIALEKTGEENGKKQEILVKKIEISDKYEIIMHMKGGLKVAFGKDNQLKEKMNAFVDIYGSSAEQLTKTPGTLQMQWLNDDGSYTFIKDKKKKN